MAIEKILLVDDEILVCDVLAETLRQKGFEVVTADNGQKALDLFKEASFDMLITDMKMPGLTGIELLKKAKELNPSLLVVIITAYGSIENAVEAMRLGAFHYLLKPFTADAILAIIEKGKEHVSLVAENHYLRQDSRPYLDIIGESPAIKQVLADVERVAKTNASVFISGESGTGKEVIAHALHYQSTRSQKPFIKVNCAAIPETLIESEFFGHEKGSFTGANAKRLGRFELANGGTLLLDEITEIPLLLQAKLLRVIQEQEFERVGGTKPVVVDVRLISTSNREIKDAIAKKVLREDLYYRLNVVPIHLPPLRERREDILPLAKYFLKKVAQENHSKLKSFTADAEKKLEQYNWPGNIRELANVIERAVVMDASPTIGPELLQLEQTVQVVPSGTVLPIGSTLDELEKRFIIETLQAQQNNRTKTAEVLGISIRTLRNKLNAYNFEA